MCAFTRKASRMSETCSTIEAAARAGVSVRQLTEWADRGYLRPLRQGNGDQQGTRWRWEARDIDAAARFGALSHALRSPRWLFTTFGQAFTLPHGDAVGILMDCGRFAVSIEVRHQQSANEVSHADNGNGRAH
jgi:hypothetical protein